jgi:thiamine-phosphate pyrophosphorylase
LLLYYITERRQFSGCETEQKEKLLAKIAEAAACGVDFVQLRERDLSGRQLEALADDALSAIRKACSGAPAVGKTDEQLITGTCKLLINSRLDVALATGADGVHLRSSDISAGEARAIVARASHGQRSPFPERFLISASCHTAPEVRLAEAHGADVVLFGPVFEKRDSSTPPHGIAGLRAVCRDRKAAQPPVPVLALGGVTLRNAQSCVRAGAGGVAGIRLFQQGDLRATVEKLRALERLQRS